MSLPLVEKTWQYNVSQQLVSTGTIQGNCQQLLFAIKQSMTTFASSPWTVVRSSNATSVADSDLWIAPGNLLANQSTLARSWIVLQQAGLHNTQICLDYNSANNSGIYNQIGVWVSPDGLFTGGTTTARATATDEYLTTSASNSYFAITDGTSSYSLHALQTADGYCTRLFYCSSGVLKGLWLFDTLTDTPVTNKVVTSVSGLNTAGSGSYLSHSSFYNSAIVCGKLGSIDYTGYIGSEAYNNNLVVTAGNGSISGITGAYPITAISLHSETAGTRGRVGRFSDLYFGSSSLSPGTTYPVSPDDKEYCQLTPFVMPWNGSVPII
jgi:hypothetical protein